MCKMNSDQLVSYALPIAMIAFLAWRWWGFRSVRQQLPELLKTGAQIVDVRSPAEYAAGHAPGSKNIPLGDLAQNASKLDKAKPIVLCCASGSRSGMAAGILKSQGFSKVINAGPWQNLLS